MVLNIPTVDISIRVPIARAAKLAAQAAARSGNPSRARTDAALAQISNAPSRKGSCQLLYSSRPGHEGDRERQLDVKSRFVAYVRLSIARFLREPDHAWPKDRNDYEILRRGRPTATDNPGFIVQGFVDGVID